MSKILTDNYTAVLKMAGLAVTEDGCVSIIDDKKHKPLTIKGKRLVLPTPQHLNNVDWEHRIVFHPGYENFHRGESVVLERYRNLLMLHLNEVIAADIHRFLSLGVDLDAQAKMTPDQQEYLIWVKEAKKETGERFEKILGNIPQSDLPKTFVKVFMKRGAKLEGRDFGRAGIVSFPFYEMLVEEQGKKGQKKIHGVSVNAGDLTALIHLMEYMFPGITIPDKYSRGTNVQTNPLFDSLMRTALSIAEPLNSLYSLFGEMLGDDMAIDVTWSKAVMENDVFYKEVLKVPMQSGNEGTSAVSTNDPAPAQPLTHPSVKNVPAPATQQLTGFAALTGRAPDAPVAAPMQPMYTAPVIQPMQPIQPQPVYQAPQQQLYNQFGQPVAQAHQAVNVRNPDGSTNFAALIASDPALAQAAGATQFNNNGYQHRSAPNTRATLSNPVAQVNTGWGNNNGWNQPNNGWGQPQPQQQQNGWGNPPAFNGGYASI